MAKKGDLSDEIIESLKTKGEYRIPNVGVIKVVERSARKGRNPRTGEVIDIAARKALTIKESKNILEVLNG